jgi:uncharacterized protein
VALIVEPAIFEGRVMHKRQQPVENGFVYPIYYLSMPLDRMADLNDGWRFGVNRPGVMSFQARDHGNHSEPDLRPWIRDILDQHGSTEITTITLMALPRVFGYVFNPISFWFCHDSDHNLRAVLCEVNNTFGETHSYLCMNENRTPITPDTWLTAEKIFHVSPFLERQGNYRFRFAVNDEKISIWINYHDEKKGIDLLTSLTGKLTPYTRAARRRVFWRYPLVTLMAIYRIHWQALKLWGKGVRYVSKPVQHPERMSKTNITKI